ncbi:hypothetical protein BC829DRAFT_391947 [Chytridium lagenaria]|nr:hypothetical protein BC829DRAFT_391947 [Chytridium lagenaria]
MRTNNNATTATTVSGTVNVKQTATTTTTTTAGNTPPTTLRTPQQASTAGDRYYKHPQRHSSAEGTASVVETIQVASPPLPSGGSRRVPKLSWQILLAMFVLGTWTLGVASIFTPSISSVSKLNYDSLKDIPAGDPSWESVTFGFFHYCYTARKNTTKPIEYMCRSISPLCSLRTNVTARNDEDADGIGASTACRALTTAGTLSIVSRMLTPVSYYLIWLLVVKRVMDSNPLSGKYTPKFIFVTSMGLCATSVGVTACSLIMGTVVLMGTTALTGSYVYQSIIGLGTKLIVASILCEITLILLTFWWLFPVVFRRYPYQSMHQDGKEMDYSIVTIQTRGNPLSATDRGPGALRREPHDIDTIPIATSISSGNIMVVSQDTNDSDANRMFPPPRPSTDAAKTLVETQEPTEPAPPVPRGTVVFDDEPPAVATLRARGAHGFVGQQDFSALDLRPVVTMPPPAAAFSSPYPSAMMGVGMKVLQPRHPTIYPPIPPSSLVALVWRAQRGSRGFRRLCIIGWRTRQRFRHGVPDGILEGTENV